MEFVAPELPGALGSAQGLSGAPGSSQEISEPLRKPFRRPGMSSQELPRALRNFHELSRALNSIATNNDSDTGIGVLRKALRNDLGDSQELS